MIQQFFILSNWGDVLIKRDYKHQIPFNTTELFYREVQQEQNIDQPVLNIEGVNFYFIKRQSVILVLLSLNNENSLRMVQTILQLENMIQDFIGVLSEDQIRVKFILIYEILDEMIDFGFPTHENADQILPLIFQTEENEKDTKNKGPSFFDKSHIKADQSLISVTDYDKRNDIFLDIIQNLKIWVNSQGELLEQMEEGELRIKSYLAASPRVRLQIDKTNSIKDPVFHHVVERDEFESQGRLYFKAVKGKTHIMRYRNWERTPLPIKSRVYVIKDSDFWVEIGLLLELGKEYLSGAQILEIELKVPSVVNSIFVESELKKDSWSFDHNQQQNINVLKVFKVSSGIAIQFKYRITLDKNLNENQIKKLFGFLKIKFEINSKENSGLQLKSMNIEGLEKESSNKWIRYLTVSDNYLIML